MYQIYSSSGTLSIRSKRIRSIVHQALYLLDLNVRPETIKLLEENIGKIFSDINHSRILYVPPPRVMEIKAKINKLDLFDFFHQCFIVLHI